MIVLSIGVFIIGFQIVNNQNQHHQEEMKASILTEKMIQRYENEIHTQKNAARLIAVKKSYKDYIESVIENEFSYLNDEIKERLLHADISL